LGAVEYCELEKRISTFHNSSIKNGMAPSYIISMRNGDPDPEAKTALERNVRNALSGENNAGNILILYNDPGQEAAEITTVQLSDADKQYQFLSGECVDKIMIGHRVVSGLLFGVDKATGFGSNADEMKQAEEIMRAYVLKPCREMMQRGFKPLFEVLGVTDAVWLDAEKVSIPQSPTPTQLSKHDEELPDCVSEYLQSKGEDIDENEWELIDSRPEDYNTNLDGALKFASVMSSNPNGESEQDNELFKVRYSYAPNQAGSNSRSFCFKMVGAGKVYRKEDIQAAGDRAVNPGFGPGGASTYDIWLYKGGPECHHFWERRVYMRRNNKKITVNEARKLINELAPSERDAVRLPVNDSDVARRPTDMPNHGYLNPRN